MRTFKFDKKYYDRQLFTNEELVIKPGVNVLVGSNGTGKSTILDNITNKIKNEAYDEETFKKNEDIEMFTYDNLKNGGSNAKEQYLGYGKMELLATSMFSSEGENIILNFGENIAAKLGKLHKEGKKPKEIWIIVDAVDSGLSIDNIVQVKNFFNLILDNEVDSEVYIVVSANTYEMTIDVDRCIDVTNFKEITFNTYDSYKKFIIKSNEQKEKFIKKFERSNKNE